MSGCGSYKVGLDRGVEMPTLMFSGCAEVRSWQASLLTAPGKGARDSQLLSYIILEM